MGSSGAAIEDTTIAGNRQTGDYTLVPADAGKAIEMNTVGPTTLTVPPDSSVPFPVGTVIEVFQYGDGRTTIAAGAGVTLRSPQGELALSGKFCAAALRKLAANEWSVEGHLVDPQDTVGSSRQTDNYTLGLADISTVVEMNKATANTLTVPPDSTVAFARGTMIELFQYGAGQTTIVAGAGVTIRSSGGKLKLTGQYSAASLRKIDTNEWALVGDLSA